MLKQSAVSWLSSLAWWGLVDWRRRVLRRPAVFAGERLLLNLILFGEAHTGIVIPRTPLTVPIVVAAHPIIMGELSAAITRVLLFTDGLYDNIPIGFSLLLANGYGGGQRKQTDEVLILIGWRYFLADEIIGTVLFQIKAIEKCPLSDRSDLLGIDSPDVVCAILQCWLVSGALVAVASDEFLSWWWHIPAEISLRVGGCALGCGPSTATPCMLRCY